MMGGLDAFNEQAFGVLTSSRLVEALDVEQGRSAHSRALRQGRPARIATTAGRS